MFSVSHRSYVLIVLTSAYTLSLLDRGLVMLLLQSMKVDLQLTDSQLGFVTGIAFSLLYATLGLPIARWADRGNRVSIICAALVVGSLAVMSILFVTNFIQLILARMAAAVGEAGTKPPAYSLLGDYFEEPNERTHTMAIYFTGSALASLISFVLGGWLNEQYGWRLVFLLLAIPQLAVALLIRLTVAEPRRMLPAENDNPDLPSWKCVLRTMWRQPAMRNIIVALVLLQVMGSGLGPWYAAFMIRVHKIGTAELGVWLGLIFGFAGLAGLLFGSWAATKWFSGNERALMRLSAATTAALVPCFVAFLFLPGRYWALVALIPMITVFYCYVGPTYALMQRLAPSRMRATTLALVLLIANIVGGGVGPQIVGFLSDLLSNVAGEASLRWAMLSMTLVTLGSAWHFLKASRTITHDLDPEAATKISAAAYATPAPMPKASR